jgi:class I lanthipeptide synthase
MPDGPPEFEASEFFALRTPLLPRDVLGALGKGLAAPRAFASGTPLEPALEEDRARTIEGLRTLVADPVVREALFVASPSLDEALEAWLHDPRSPRARGVTDILVRYIARMAARPTPFGLFSGCSVGALGERTILALAPRGSYRRHTRLDMHYLTALCEALHADTALRGGLRFKPSTGLYEAAGQLRYAESRSDPKTRELSYHLVSLERTDYLEATLERAKAGARPGDLARDLVEHDAEVAPDEAERYIDQLIDSQVLVSDLAPPITGGEPVRGILATLEAADGSHGTAAVLRRAADEVGALDEAGLGLAPSRYRAIAETLGALPAKPNLARLFQVDLYKPVSHAELGPEVLRELERSVVLLLRVAEPAAGLARFRDELVARYGERIDGPLSEHSTVPLVEVLDDEAGIGFASDEGEPAEPSPLLEGLDVPPDPAPPRVAFGPRETLLLRHIGEAERRRAREWVLGEEDLRRLQPKTRAELPGAFAVAATLAASSPAACDRGDFRLFVQGISGPSGATLLGRFCHGDAALRRAVEAHLRAEESSRPGAIFAEVVHLPEGRLGNILCRPALRRHEIPYLGRSGVSGELQIPVTDLRVGLERGRLVLYSARHGREIVPRLTSAHNYPAAALGIYRFLCALQHEGQAHALGWSWGPLAAAPFLPRVTSGRTVLAKARWNLAKDQLAPFAAKETDADRYRRAQRLRADLGLPRWVGLADGDNVLPVDLDSVLHVDSFAQLVKARESASLVELLDEEDLLATGPEGRFVHELVVPFVTKGGAREANEAAARPAPSPSPKRAVARSFVPGSEWLYAKLYTGTATADALLKEVVAPLVATARASQALEGWFFIRYGDPKWHLRVRVRGDPRGIVSTVAPRLEEASRPLLADGRLSKVELGTYEREVGRYGGPEGIELAEGVFEADSDAVLAIVELLERDEGADARWRLTLRGMHLLLLDLGLELAARTELVGTMRAGFAAEHRVDTGFEKQLGAKFRAERPALEALLATPVGTEHPLDPGFEILARRSEALRPVIRELAAREKAGRLTLPLAEIAPSLLHMHANRLLRSDQRTQELVLYDFLLRLYESEAARARRGR